MLFAAGLGVQLLNMADSSINALMEAFSAASLHASQAPQEEEDDDDVLIVGAASASSASKPHASIQGMLSLAKLEVLPVAGDGNCAYHSSCAALGELDEAKLRSLGLWRVEHATKPARPVATPEDLRLQAVVRGRCVDFLQRAESAEHRVVGSSMATPVPDLQRPGHYEAVPAPPATAMEKHRRTGVYATVPLLRALAEVLDCVIISIDAMNLFDRVPVFIPGTQKTVALMSWRTQLAPLVAQHRPHRWGGSGAAQRLAIVIINNGRHDAGGHFNATRTSARDLHLARGEG